MPKLRMRKIRTIAVLPTLFTLGNLICGFFAIVVASRVERPMTDDPAGRSFARSRADVLASLATSMHTAGVAAMVYPTMPFNAPRAVDRWPDVRTALGYGNWLGLPEVSVPAGRGAGRGGKMAGRERGSPRSLEA